MNRPLRALRIAALATSLALVPAAGASAGAVRGHDTARGFFDARPKGQARPPLRTARARAAMEGLLGEGGEVQTDARTGALAFIGRTDGFLTGPSDEPAATIALDYLRGHPASFGLDGDDIASLKLEASDVSPDGATHLRWVQVVDGIRSLDSGVEAHLDRRGRLLAISGSPLPDLAVDPAPRELTAAEALRRARAD
ncbi:MAG TPA: hypothetical protein VJT75_12200, partial [Thermoleophilaceae bacterium]|nr:hypothetical protein [Thermoleophilaceae bacterium]